MSEQTRLFLSRETLTRALDTLTKVVERRVSIPILANIWLAPNENTLTLTVTDLDMQARMEVPCRTDALGQATTVNAGILYDITRKLPEGAEVSLAWQGEERATLRSGRSQFSLLTLPPVDFPDLQSGAFPHQFEMEAATFLAMLEKTQFAISTEETRYYLNGVYFHVSAEENPELIAVATDGHRLAKTTHPAPQGAQAIPGVIIPRKTVALLARMAREAMDKNGAGLISLALSETRIEARTNGITLTSKLIDGTFPDYTRVIPRNNAHEVTLAREALLKAVERVGAISSERGRAVVLEFSPATNGTGRLTLTTHNPETGDGEEEMEADYEQTPARTGFNSRYLSDIMGALNGDTVRLKLGEAGSPALILPEIGNALTIVLMPMRV